MINQLSILQPAMAMFMLTFFVWVWMAVTRLSYLYGNRVHPQKVATPELMNQLVPESIQNPANNFKNLFEMPVIFYALCGYLSVAGKVDGIYVSMGWLFVFFRAIHSFVHCTHNVVRYRFMAYALSSCILWLMVARFAIDVFS
jgi:hypothetical protein